jgi:hypothetical protein
VVVKPEYGRALRSVVCPNSLENTGSVVEAVREEMDIGVVPRDELTVAPDV